jgi:hypothetical protein
MKEVISIQQITNIPIGEVSKLEPIQLFNLLTEVQGYLEKYKKLKDWLQGAIALKYQEKIRAKRIRLGKDSGVVSLEDEKITVRCDLPKRVEWDQEKLFQISLRLMSEGRDIDEYIGIEYKVLEHKYKGWDELTKAMFDEARTVVVGKPEYSLSLNKVKEVVYE